MGPICVPVSTAPLMGAVLVPYEICTRVPSFATESAATPDMHTAAWPVRVTKDPASPAMTRVVDVVPAGADGPTVAVPKALPLYWYADVTLRVGVTTEVAQ